jgi:hypothetical protein
MSAPQQTRPPNTASTNSNALSIRNLQVKAPVASNEGEMLQLSLPEYLQRTENYDNKGLFVYINIETQFYALQLHKRSI